MELEQVSSQSLLSKISKHKDLASHPAMQAAIADEPVLQRLSKEAGSSAQAAIADSARSRVLGHKQMQQEISRQYEMLKALVYPPSAEAKDPPRIDLPLPDQRNGQNVAPLEKGSKPVSKSRDDEDDDDDEPEEAANDGASLEDADFAHRLAPSCGSSRSASVAGGDEGDDAYQRLHPPVDDFSSTDGEADLDDYSLGGSSDDDEEHIDLEAVSHAKAAVTEQPAVQSKSKPTKLATTDKPAKVPKTSEVQATAASQGTSMFLPSLSAGFIPGAGSDVSDAEDAQPERKNRRGQRARKA